MALQRVSKQAGVPVDAVPMRFEIPRNPVTDKLVAAFSRASGVPEHMLRAEPSPTRSKAPAETVATRTGMVVTLERRPTVDRAWVVWAASDETMIDLRVVEEGEDRKAVLAEMVKKHGGAK